MCSGGSSGSLLAMCPYIRTKYLTTGVCSLCLIIFRRRYSLSLTASSQLFYLRDVSTFFVFRYYTCGPGVVLTRLGDWQCVRSIRFVDWHHHRFSPYFCRHRFKSTICLIVHEAFCGFVFSWTP